MGGESLHQTLQIKHQTPSFRWSLMGRSLPGKSSRSFNTINFASIGHQRCYMSAGSVSPLMLAQANGIYSTSLNFSYKWFIDDIVYQSRAWSFFLEIQWFFTSQRTGSAGFDHSGSYQVTSSSCYCLNSAPKTLRRRRRWMRLHLSLGHNWLVSCTSLLVNNHSRTDFLLILQENVVI